MRQLEPWVSHLHGLFRNVRIVASTGPPGKPMQSKSVDNHAWQDAGENNGAS
jgi:hypothetical protein